VSATRRWALLCAGIAVLWSSAAFASGGQDLRKDYALIFGTVYGPDNRPVQGMKIKIRRADQKKAKWELTSDSHGEFAQRFPTGTADYVVWPDLKDKAAAEKATVKVHIDNDERQDISLHLSK
jgi:hypothetical protein